MGGSRVVAATRCGVARRERTTALARAHGYHLIRASSFAARSWNPGIRQAISALRPFACIVDAAVHLFVRLSCFRVEAPATLVGFPDLRLLMYACPTSTEGIRGRRMDSPTTPAAALDEPPARGPGIQVSTPPVAVVVTSQLTLGATAHEAGGWPGVLYGHSFTRPRVGSRRLPLDVYSQQGNSKEAHS